MATDNIFSQSWARKTLDWLASGTGSAPGTLYLAILSTVPTTDGGTGVVEFTNYSGSNRPTITFGSATGTTASLFQQIASSNSQSFSITGSDTILGVAVTTTQSKTTALTATDFQTGGSVIWFGDIASAPTGTAVSNGNTLTFNTGEIVIKLF